MKSLEMARVLLIEDVPVVRMVIRKMLEAAGHMVTEAADGQAGLNQLAEGRFDLIIADIWMPNVDGLSFIRQVRERQMRVRILAISGGAPRAPMQFSLREAETAGADAVLLKPVDRSELQEAVARLLGLNSETG